MSIDPMVTQVAIFPVAADTEGFWLLSSLGPWRSTEPVPGDSTPMNEVKLMLDKVRAGGTVYPVLVHQTSDLAAVGEQFCNFVAVYDVADLVVDEWPRAAALDIQRILTAHGTPEPHPSTEAPAQVRAMDVALHAIRHLAFLNQYDAQARKDLPWIVKRKLSDVAPALFGLFEGVYEEPATVDVRDAA